MHRRAFLMTSAAATVAASLPAGAAPPTASPLLAVWTGQHGGAPRFAGASAASIKTALIESIDQCRAEIAAITADTRPATFENTLAAFDDTGRALGRAQSYFGIYTSTMNDEAMRAVETEMGPRLAAFSDEVTQNGPLFARIKAVYDARETSGLTPEQKRLAWVVYNRFARQGAALNGADKTRLAEINQKLAALYTQFSQNQLHDEETQTFDIANEADLAGLPPQLRDAAKATAGEKGKSGWALANTRSSVEPFLMYSSRRDLREGAWRMWTSRGEHAGAHDNRPVMTQILALRGEKAQLLGHPTHAHWILDGNMAKKPDAAMDLMLKLWKPAVARVREEVADMQQLASADNIQIAAWDYRYYAEKVRKAKYDFDENEVKPYLQLEKMREAMFWTAGQCYGLTFAPIANVEVYHPDVRVWEVTRRGQRIGLWYFDPYARAGKQSGAWMNEYRTQERFRRPVTPIVSNNCNYVKGEAGKPVLISWDDAETMFHEFGHALHGLLSNVRYPTLAGTNTLRDFVEFPSQINERWLSTPEVLNRFATHVETGQPIPQALLDKIQRAKNFNQGFKTVEFMASALYDMRIHLETAHPIDAAAFETRLMTELGMPNEIVMRHRPTAFGHIFSGDGYSAGYYGYLWADALTADAWEAFVEAGGPWDKPTARRFQDTILAIGNTVDPADAFRNFRGRDVNTAALMRDRGFAVT